MQADIAVTTEDFMRSHGARWQAAWDRLGAPAEPGLLQRLVAAYAQPHRHYHTLEHLDDCLRQLEPARPLAEHAAEVELALWFHDAIYAIGATDNELRSADWARGALLDAGCTAQVANRVHALVMVTCHTVEPQRDDECLLLDVDLSILGAPEDRFERYEQQVRVEFASVPEAQRASRRKAILQRFLARPRIYRTGFFHDRLEARARANLARSIARLGAEPVN